MGRRARERDYDETSQDARISALERSQAEPGPPAAATPPVLDQLARLVTLHDKGALSDEEFAAAKAKVLAG
jgi:Short C-terminal domain